MFVALFSSAQTITTEPANIIPDEEVTFTFDFTGTALAGKDNIWIWSWVANEDESYKGPDAPTNVNPAGDGQVAAKLVATDEPNVFTLTMVPTEFYNVAATEIPKIGMLAKGRDWSDGQTSDAFFDVEPPVFESPVVRTFPTAFSQQDVVSVFYDSKLEENEALKNEQNLYLYISVAGTYNDGSAMAFDDNLLPIDEKVKLRALGNGLYKLSFIPEKFFGLSSEDNIQRLIFKIQNQDGSQSNPPSEFGLQEADVFEAAN